MAEKDKRREMRLMLALLSLVLILLAVYLILGMRDRGEFVVVEVRGKVYATLPLDEDATLRIEGDRGYNLLVIKDGRAFISDADCPGHDCVRHGAISPDTPMNLRMISCLPHSVVIYLKEGGK